jgi:hypothetical protein
MKEKLFEKLSEILERDLTKVEEAIIDWTIIQVQYGNLEKDN